MWLKKLIKQAVGAVKAGGALLLQDRLNMASTVDIANFALNNLGASNITSLDENSKAARVVNQRYESVRDAVFRAHPWNCLINRASLAQETTTPAFGYTFQYALPTDPFCLTSARI